MIYPLLLVLIKQCGATACRHKRFLSRCFTGDLFNLYVNNVLLPTSSSAKLGLLPCFIIHPLSFTVANSNPATQGSRVHNIFCSRSPSVGSRGEVTLGRHQNLPGSLQVLPLLHCISTASLVYKSGVRLL